MATIATTTNSMMIPFSAPGMVTIFDSHHPSAAPNNVHLKQNTCNIILEFVYYVGMDRWSFLTNHARVLLCIAHDPGVRLRDVAAVVGVTERHAHGIVADLVAAGYVVKGKDGRRNRYHIQTHLPLRDQISQERTIGELLDVLVGVDARRSEPRAERTNDG